MRKKFISVLLVLLFVCPPAVYARVKLSALPARENIFINFTESGRSLVQETRNLPLRAGRNKIDFSWENVQLDPDSVRLLFPGDQPGVELLSTSYPPGEQALVWHVASSEPRQVKVAIVYRLSGLNREISYRGFVNDTGTSLELREITTLFNVSGEDFADALLSLGDGNIHRRDWENGEAKRFSVYRKRKIPFTREYIYDARKQPHQPEDVERTPGLPVAYKLANTREHRLGDRMLQAGKVRLYQRRESAGEVLTGETRLSKTPPGDSISLRLGKNRDLKVEQNKVREERKNVVRDDYDQLEMYDSEEIIEVDIKNFKSEPVTLRVREKLPGEWEMLESNYDYRKLSNQLIEFKLRLPPEGRDKLRFHYIRRHVGRDL